jgi:signal transduction histidine kinase
MAQQSKSAPVSNMARKFSLSAFLDYFIPREIQVQPDAHRRARMFMISHVFGPFLGIVIPLYLHFFLDIATDYRFWTFLASILAFWLYPFVLRSTKRYQTIAFISVQNLVFCILWACYAYGGIFSPFLPWALIIPMLAFFYLPATGVIRNILLAQIIGNLGVFSILVACGYDFPYVDLRHFELIGIISNLSLSIYVSMMALYFANVVREQGVFEREMVSLVSTADHLLNLTEAARQATSAKADFVASMSHELRTPLNAVIGYSQILLEDADAEGDHDFGSDVRRINDAGTHLLRLVDDILDFSKIEAGKMACCPTAGSLRDWAASVNSEVGERLAGGPYRLECAVKDSCDVVLNVDWQILKKSVQHLIYGIATETAGGPIALQVEKASHGPIVIRITDPELRNERVATDALFDVFSDDSDASATKYGGVGIALALSLKFVQLIAGKIVVDTDRNGRRVFTMTIPIEAAAEALAA